MHPAKLATDAAADVVSTWLMWRGRPGTALLVAHAAAGAASAVVARRDLSALGHTRRGRYVLAHMPASAQAVRYAGQLVVWHAASRHRPWGVALGHLVVAAGWSHGLVARVPRGPRRLTAVRSGRSAAGWPS